MGEIFTHIYPGCNVTVCSLPDDSQDSGGIWFGSEMRSDANSWFMRHQNGYLAQSRVTANDEQTATKNCI